MQGSLSHLNLCQKDFPCEPYGTGRDFPSAPCKASRKPASAINNPSADIPDFRFCSSLLLPAHPSQPVFQRQRWKLPRKKENTNSPKTAAKYGVSFFPTPIFSWEKLKSNGKWKWQISNIPSPSTYRKNCWTTYLCIHKHSLTRVQIWRRGGSVLFCFPLKQQEHIHRGGKEWSLGGNQQSNYPRGQLSCFIR